MNVEVKFFFVKIQNKWRGDWVGGSGGGRVGWGGLGWM